MDIRVDTPDSPEVKALLDLHMQGMLANSPPGTCHFLDHSALAQPDVTLWSIWQEQDLAGVGAMLELAADHGELKSMRTDPAYLGKGVGRALLTHILTEARTRGYRRVSLETGVGEPFAAAEHLYRRFGFVETAPFAAYTESDSNRYFALDLGAFEH